ncbi:AIPR family protein [Nonomuraea sp. NPDC046802]|uniref:AIPR family protein n=1 Tax=Nonomuraea sp. NPDC046802 TaxID=3154919 RepID=UPI0033FF5A00
MVNNDLVLIDQVLKQRQQEASSPPSDDRAFEIFACEQAVTMGDPSLEEIEAGVIGGGGDGAIDGVYVFLGEKLLEEDSEVLSEGFKASSISTGSRLVLWLVQAKRTPSFTETALDLVASSTKRLLDLAESEEDLLKLYGEALVRRIGLFRRALKTLATRHPQVEVYFSYVTRGDADNVNAKVRIKAADLERSFAKLAAGGGSRVEFLGASELWQRANQAQSYTLELPYQESITHGTSHIALVRLGDYQKFLSKDDGSLRRHIFDWNVRDYQGGVEVNREIKTSLLDLEAPQFWWLNNGVTIVCSRVSAVGKVFSLDDVQIVNGLQTSHTIHQALRNLDGDHPAFGRLVQVRILLTEDPAHRDHVIRATNRQTSVPVASLHATDEIQRKIESYFLKHDWYYDRRKNFYRNSGKPADRIVSIPLLAQSVMAMGFSEPNNSRARPSSLLKGKVEYSRIFSDKIALVVYLWFAQQQRIVDDFLTAAVATSERINLRFHLAMLSAAALVDAWVFSPAQLSRVAEKGVHSSPEELAGLLAHLVEKRNIYCAETGDSHDKIAKGVDFVDSLRSSPFVGGYDRP